MRALRCLPHNLTHHDTLGILLGFLRVLRGVGGGRWEAESSVYLFGGHREEHTLTSLSVPRATFPFLGVGGRSPGEWARAEHGGQ